VIGTIGLEAAEAHRDWSEDDATILKNVAERVSIALDNASLFEETQAALAQSKRLAQREQTVAMITSRIYSTIDVKSMLQFAAEELRRATGSTSATVRLGRDLGPGSEQRTQANNRSEETNAKMHPRAALGDKIIKESNP